MEGRLERRATGGSWKGGLNGGMVGMGVWWRREMGGERCSRRVWWLDRSEIGMMYGDGGLRNWSRRGLWAQTRAPFGALPLPDGFGHGRRYGRRLHVEYGM